MNSTIKQEIIRQLDHLPLELQRRVLDFTQALLISSPKGIPGKRLLHFAGVLGTEEIQAIAQAIEAGCERVDANEW